MKILLKYTSILLGMLVIQTASATELLFWSLNGSGDSAYKTDFVNLGEGVQFIAGNSLGKVVSPDGLYVYCYCADGLGFGQYAIYKKAVSDVTLTPGTKISPSQAKSDRPALSISPDGLYVYYANINDGYKIYKKSTSDNLEGVAINSVNSYVPYATTDGYIYYTQIPSNKIFKKQANDVSDGVDTGHLGFYPVVSNDLQYLYFLSSVNLKVKKVTLSSGSSVDLVNNYNSSVFNPLAISEEGELYYTRTITGGKTPIERYSTQTDTVYTITPSYNARFPAITNVLTPPTPPLTPVSDIVNGLICSTEYYPVMSGVSWYSDYGALASRETHTENISDGTVFVQTGSGAGGLNYDVMALLGSSSGTNIPIGSITFTGTTVANIGDDSFSGGTPFLQGWIKRDGAYAGWNTIQYRGVNTSGFFGKFGLFSAKLADGSSTDEVLMYATGGIAQAWLSNSQVGTKWQVYSPTSGFSGVRVGYAPYGTYKSCKKEGINSCAWRIEAGVNTCGAVIQQGFEVGVCGVTGSGSIYGSGSCVPLTDETGAIVDAGIVPGQGVVVTLPDGSEKLVRVPKDYNSDIFSCPKSAEAPWYKYIFSCGAEVLANISNRVSGGTRTLVESQVGTYTNERVYMGTFTGYLSQFGSGSSPLVGSGANISTGALVVALKGKLDTVGTPGPEIWQRFFSAGVAVGILALMLTFLGWIVAGLRQDRDAEVTRNNR